MLYRKSLLPWGMIFLPMVIAVMVGEILTQAAQQDFVNAAVLAYVLGKFILLLYYNTTRSLFSYHRGDTSFAIRWFTVSIIFYASGLFIFTQYR